MQGHPGYHLRDYHTAVADCNSARAPRLCTVREAENYLSCHHKSSPWAKMLLARLAGSPNADLDLLLKGEFTKKSTHEILHRILPQCGRDITVPEMINIVATSMGAAIGKLVIYRSAEDGVLSAQRDARVAAYNAWAKGVGRAEHMPLRRGVLPCAENMEHYLYLSPQGRTMAGYPSGYCSPVGFR